MAGAVGRSAVREAVGPSSAPTGLWKRAAGRRHHYDRLTGASACSGRAVVGVARATEPPWRVACCRVRCFICGEAHQRAVRDRFGAVGDFAFGRASHDALAGPYRKPRGSHPAGFGPSRAVPKPSVGHSGARDGAREGGGASSLTCARLLPASSAREAFGKIGLDLKELANSLGVKTARILLFMNS